MLTPYLKVGYTVHSCNGGFAAVVSIPHHLFFKITRTPPRLRHRPLHSRRIAAALDQYRDRTRGNFSSSGRYSFPALDRFWADSPRLRSSHGDLTTWLQLNGYSSLRISRLGVPPWQRQIRGASGMAPLAAGASRTTCRETGTAGRHWWVVSVSGFCMGPQ